MTSTVTESHTLDQLQSPEQVALLDAIDKLRRQGLAHYNISLPQLIVCGDQSSGKSSVLEGLTRLRFPTKDGLCTTFATELVLRKHAVVEIACTIAPGKKRSPAEKDELAKFKRCFASREEFKFPLLLKEARDRMAFGSKSDHGLFFDDVLQIKFSGPDVPSLTVVDLPGIIHSDIEGRSGIQTVRNLVRGYMADKSSIILAVVSAKSDLNTQVVLRYIKEFDDKAIRTLGIITKPDTLDATSDSENTFVELAKNKISSAYLELGWHVVKNRGFGMTDSSDAERDESERQFFAARVWNALPRENIGIETLRTKLSRVLLQHIRKELPSVSAAIQSALLATESSLKALGDPRDEQQQQRNFLMGKAQKFQALTLDALRGLYSDRFFALSPTDNIPSTRLRTVIHDLNLAFAYTMYYKGHQHQIVDTQNMPGLAYECLSSSATPNYDELPDPIRIDQARFLEEHIGNQVRLSRPSGLPSLVNPWVIGEVFRQQAQPWQAIAEQHLSDVNQAVLAYLEESLPSMMDRETFSALMVEHIDPELEKRRMRLDEKLNELLVPYQKQEPIIYDPSFIHDLEQTRAKRYFEPKANSTFIKGSQKSAPAQLLTESMDDFTNREILNLMNTYYKKAISMFISNVTVLAIENCLITDLPSLLDPELVLNMDEGKLGRIASESEDIRIERAALKQKLGDLKAGKQVLDSQSRKSSLAQRTPRRLRQTVYNQKAPEAQNNRQRTPAPPLASGNLSDQIDSLASNFSSITVTPPSTSPTLKAVQPQVVPITPPKSPKMVDEPESIDEQGFSIAQIRPTRSRRSTPKGAMRPSPPRWAMRADTMKTSDEEDC